METPEDLTHNVKSSNLEINIDDVGELFYSRYCLDEIHAPRRNRNSAICCEAMKKDLVPIRHKDAAS